ncbi:hypothetical protein NLG97_g278 [Lecanicillium saksenae]|uniref:Uncharacterized protein n=1 Tax=Lecanicillium saksenae TaxID=468837 RepID=A0ACC1R9P9_9HYPO|nr:hypothetical protein NLG97_g278 [Lecanicillium saksenae]
MHPNCQKLINRVAEFLSEVENLTPGRDLEARLNGEYGPGNAFYDDFSTLIREGIEKDEGWVATDEVQGPHYRRTRISPPTDATRFCSITTVYMDPQGNDLLRGQYHLHPYGEINCVIPMSDGAQLKGMSGWQGAGWTSPGPDRENAETVAATVIQALGILGVVTKAWPGHSSAGHATLSRGRAAPLLAGLATTVYFILNSVWLGHVDVSWLMLASQTGLVLAERSYEKRFIASLNGATMCCAHLVALYCGEASIAQGLATLTLLCAYLFVPRSADPYVNGKLVDRQASASLLERLSFTWAVKSFDEKCDNLPVLPAQRQTAATAKRYADRADRTASLSRTLFRQFFGHIMLQWVFTVIRSALAVAPQYFKYRLLEHLGAGSINVSHGFYLAIAYGGSKLLNTWLSSASEWLRDLYIQYPVQTILMALVCDKSLRMPNVVSAESKKGHSTRSIFADMRMDGARASMVFTESHVIPSTVAKLITTSIFLNKLVGWQILAVTMGFTILLIAVDSQITKKHHQFNAEVMNQRREGAAVLGDALLAIRQIKFSASEDDWIKKISENREKDIKLSYRNSVLLSASRLNHAIGSAVLAGIPLCVSALRGDKLTAAVAFTFLSLFQQLQVNLTALPFRISYWVEGWNALQRLQGHLDVVEAQKTTDVASDEIFMDKATLAWNNNVKEKKGFELEASLSFPRGQLSIVTGETASGKSLLLNALAGEAALLSGNVRGPIPQETSLGDNYSAGKLEQELAIVTQTPWMDNLSVRENIIFGQSFDKERYETVIHCCALTKDLETLTDGDSTVIGTKGISLSGGQRWRIALARSLYSQANTIILDDILSAVDAEVREWLVDKALCGPLGQGRTRILATHHAGHCAQKAALIVTLENGKAKKAMKLNITKPDVDMTDTDEQQVKKVPSRQSQPKLERTSTVLEKSTESPYQIYYRAIGGAKLVIFAFATVALTTGLRYLSTRWLQNWTARYEKLDQTDDYGGSEATYFGGIYLLISVVSSFVTAATLRLSLIIGFRASRPMASAALAGVFHSPLQWLERTSRGEITQRISSDMMVLDRNIPEGLVDALRCGMDLAVILFTSFSVSGYEAISTILLLFLYYRITKKLMPVTQKLQELSTTASSAMYQRLSELQQTDALLTLRTFNMRGYFLNDVYKLIDDRDRYAWYKNLCNVMMDFQLQAVSILFVTSIAVGAVTTHADAGATGVALLFASQFSSTMSRFLTRIVDLDRAMVSVSRVHEYADLPTENMNGDKVPEDWPRLGSLEVSSLTAGYDANFHTSVLNQLSFSVKSGERVGIVGRTGAGKSSLILALTRHLHMRGRIAIDGVDLETLNLKQLRQRLFVISQDPYLFGGKLRDVVDRAGTHDDEEIRSILSKIGFSTTPNGAAAAEIDLSFIINRGGLNLSQGQRQMLRLAQALLSRSRMVIMDEATSAIDSDADAAIQVALREILADTTLLVVAHRLATVADFDQVVVLEDGRLVESGPPADLYKRQGAFWKLVNASADKEELLKIFS